jgi:integrase/recombinase XerD
MRAEVDFETGLAELAGSWLLTLEAERKSPATIKAYKAATDGFLRWHVTRYPDAVPMLDAAVVSAYIVDLGRAGQSAGTQRLRQTALKLFSRYLTMEGEQDRDGLVNLRLPKADNPVVPTLSDSELTGLLKACRGNDLASRRDDALVRLMASVGLRAGEVIGLRVADVDLAEKTVTVRRGKGGKGRTVGIGPVVARSLDRYLRVRRTHKRAYQVDDLWVGDQGRLFHYGGLARALGVRAQMAGIEHFTCHRLRHTTASRWLAAGGSEDGLMAMMGWSDRNMVQRYTSDTQQVRARAEAARLRLDDM